MRIFTSPAQQPTVQLVGKVSNEYREMLASITRGPETIGASVSSISKLTIE